MTTLALLLLAALQSGKPYEDPDGRYAIEIPKGWSIETPEEPKGRLVAKSPATDRTGASLILDAGPPMEAIASGRLSLEQYVEKVKEDYPEAFPTFEWKEAKAGRAGEHPSVTLAFTYESGGQKIGQLQVLVWTEKAYYSINWACLASAFDRSRPKFETLTKTFAPKE